MCGRSATRGEVEEQGVGIVVVSVVGYGACSTRPR